jgi:hypothetical protein
MGGNRPATYLCTAWITSSVSAAGAALAIRFAAAADGGRIPQQDVCVHSRVRGGMQCFPQLTPSYA